jgi:hypothetical protein
MPDVQARFSRCVGVCPEGSGCKKGFGKIAAIHPSTSIIRLSK